MSSIRGVKDRRFHFTQVLNSMIEDPKLKLSAKGLILYCLSKPYDWNFRVDQLAEVLFEGRDAIYSAITECIKNGYAFRYQMRTGNGKLGPVQFEISDSKEEILKRRKEISSLEEFKKCLPLTAFPDPANPDAVHIYSNTEYTNKKQQSRSNDIEIPAVLPAAFSSNKNAKSQLSGNAGQFSIPPDPRPQKPKEPIQIYECVNVLDIPYDSKEQICRLLTEEQAKHGIHETKMRKKPADNPPGFIIWAGKRLGTDQSQKPNTEQTNKDYAKSATKDIVLPPSSTLDILSKYIAFNYGQKTVIIQYGDPFFRSKIDEQVLVNKNYQNNYMKNLQKAAIRKPGYA